MSSQLQQLAAAVRGLADEAGQPMQVLAQLQQRAQQLAGRAHTLGEDGKAVAEPLRELQASLGAVAAAMSTLRGDAHRFAAFLANGGAAVMGGRFEGGPDRLNPQRTPKLEPRVGDDSRGSVRIGPELVQVAIANGWPPADPADGYVIPPGTSSGRYRDPGAAERDSLAAAVDQAGADQPQDWIQYVNPNYGSVHGSKIWTQNCGPCSRAFADAFHGHSKLPALGDTGTLTEGPGEYREMWDTLGIGAPRAFRNNSVLSGIAPKDFDDNAAAFTNRAYSRIGDLLDELSPGTVAIIGVDWDGASAALLIGKDPREVGGHWFNAFVDRAGQVWWADAQSGRYAPWPPKYKTGIWNAQLAVRAPGASGWTGVDL